MPTLTSEAHAGLSSNAVCRAVTHDVGSPSSHAMKKRLPRARGRAGPGRVSRRQTGRRRVTQAQQRGVELRSGIRAPLHVLDDAVVVVAVVEFGEHGAPRLDDGRLRHAVVVQRGRWCWRRRCSRRCRRLAFGHGVLGRRQPLLALLGRDSGRPVVVSLILARLHFQLLLLLRLDVVVVLLLHAILAIIAVLSVLPAAPSRCSSHLHLLDVLVPLCLALRQYKRAVLSVDGDLIELFAAVALHGKDSLLADRDGHLVADLALRALHHEQCLGDLFQPLPDIGHCPTEQSAKGTAAPSLGSRLDFPQSRDEVSMHPRKGYWGMG